MIGESGHLPLRILLRGSSSLYLPVQAFAASPLTPTRRGEKSWVRRKRRTVALDFQALRMQCLEGLFQLD